VSAVLPEARISAGGRLDAFGFLDPAAWEGATRLTPLTRAQDGLPPEQPTVVRLQGSASGLHVRFDCADSEIRCTHVRHDAALWEEETVEIFVAAGDVVPARYVEIEVNPAGTLFDAIVDNPQGRRATMRVDTSWAAAGLAARVEREAAARWSAELCLPWRAIWGRGDPPGVLRANFFRIDRPLGTEAEFSAWSPTLVEPADFHRPERFGTIVLA